MMNITRRGLHSSRVVLSTYPPMQKTKLSRRATLKHLQKTKTQFEELGDRFKFLSKHRQYEDLPGYVTPAAPPAPKFEPLQLSSTNMRPASVVPGSINDTMNLVQEHLKSETNVTQRESFQVLPSDIPQPVPSKAPLKPALAAKEEDVPLPVLPSVAGPYYSFGLNAEEIKFILQDTPEALKAIREKMASFGVGGLGEADGKTPSLDEQAEIIRRIVAIENGSSRDIRRVNKERMIALLQRTPTDVGSAEVQGQPFISFILSFRIASTDLLL